ncbi:MAG: GNAT family N-acetyltransferase [bacterium]|nr:GNAT family N-acetyltransferase [bacterium]
MNSQDVNLIDSIDENIEEILSMMESFNAIDNYPFDKDQRTKNITEFINNPYLGRLWLIRKSNDVVGYLVLTFGFSFEYGGRDAIIDEFFIEDGYRRQGIGNKVMSLLVEEADKLKVNAIHLEVEHSNERAHKLYIKNGFQGNDRGLLTKVFNTN